MTAPLYGGPSRRFRGLSDVSKEGGGDPKLHAVVARPIIRRMLVEFINADTNKRIQVDIPAVPRIGERVSFRGKDRSTLHVEVVNVGYTINEPDFPTEPNEAFATVLIR